QLPGSARSLHCCTASSSLISPFLLKDPMISAGTILGRQVKGIAGLNFGIPSIEQPADVKTGADIAAWYDKKIAEHLPKVQVMTAEQLATPVDFYGMFNMPAAMYLNFMNSHTIHHRGQLSTYLRAMGGKCPSIYGGSADEPMGA
ncbi:MAG: hypothetical protein FJW36_18530, partial [Acidobacteria bacterium]|nr:hypothetical protein [Acidobacteriota bacterium]